MTEESTPARYRRLADLFSGTIGSVRAQAWDLPSPCAGWSARDVLSHVLDSEADVVTRVGLTVDRTADVTADPVDAWREVRDGIQAILDDPSRSGLSYESLGRQTTLADTVGQFLCFDLIVHRWDIGRACGVDVQMPEDDVAKGNAFLDAMGSMFYDYGASAPAVPQPDDASPQDKLLGRAGRDPQWSAS